MAFKAYKRGVGWLNLVRAKFILHDALAETKDLYIMPVRKIYIGSKGGITKVWEYASRIWKNEASYKNENTWNK